MRFIEWTILSAAALLAGCIRTPLPPAPAVPAVPDATRSSVPGPAPAAEPAGGHAMPATASPPRLTTVRNWDEYRRRAARRIAQASAGDTFTGVVPDTLKSIPVLTIQLNRDGSVRHIAVLRTPRAVPATVQMAMAAVHRAGPFGPVGNLPQPWQFNETFLYNDELKFQLRSLVE
ncbi:MAG: hypothetical protein Q8K31_04905 [Burkholderiaceae bacterium]|nr:hypothetical protein [Burkholderiaceae bacterium]MDO9089762.1 hypothetical protein [Burkholderiaceae bacterium]MDP1968508.1 hypothetical protein [Burkholderiaceae bacterium]